MAKTITVAQSGTLIDALAKEFPSTSKQKLKKMIEQSEITCNKKVIRYGKDFVESGDQLVIKPKSMSAVWDERSGGLVILHEDEWYIIAHKPAGILTSGESTPNAPTFFKRIEAYWRSQGRVRVKLHAVHRLDREVEGLVIFAKSEEAQEMIKNNWKSVKKTYLALVHGALKEPEGVISTWLKDGYKQKVFSYNREIPDSKWAVTKYRKLKDVAPDYTLVEVELETGRKNQIRVHMSELGNPIVGDFKYGAENKVIRQIRLIAYALSFKHPYTGKKIDLKIKSPKNFLTPSVDKDEKYK